LLSPPFAFLITVSELRPFCFSRPGATRARPRGPCFAFPLASRIGLDVSNLTRRPTIRVWKRAVPDLGCAHSKHCPAKVSTDAAKKTHRWVPSVRVRVLELLPSADALSAYCACASASRAASCTCACASSFGAS
jgi:hypothetical protein